MNFFDVPVMRLLGCASMQDPGGLTKMKKRRGLREQDRAYHIESNRANPNRFDILGASNDLALSVPVRFQIRSGFTCRDFAGVGRAVPGPTQEPLQASAP